MRFAAVASVSVALLNGCAEAPRVPPDDGAAATDAPLADSLPDAADDAPGPLPDIDVEPTCATFGFGLDATTEFRVGNAGDADLRVEFEPACIVSCADCFKVTCEPRLQAPCSSVLGCGKTKPDCPLLLPPATSVRIEIDFGFIGCADESGSLGEMRLHTNDPDEPLVEVAFMYADREVLDDPCPVPPGTGYCEEPK